MQQKRQAKLKPKMKNLNIKYDKFLLWLKPYTEAVEHLVPIERLKQVKLTLYSSDRPPAYHGTCERLGNNKSYRIVVRTYDVDARRWPMSPLCQEQLLCNYAHELTHLLIYKDSVVNRFVLETQIYAVFGEVLASRGYEQNLNRKQNTYEKSI